MSDSQDLQEVAGPFLAVAAFFETVIRENSGVLTLVRMIDRITVSTPHQWIASLPPVPVSTNLVVSFRGQNLSGSGTVSIRPRKPSGKELQQMDIPIDFGQRTGINLNIELDMMVDEEGYYWIDILLDDEFVTRTPLQIVFRQATDTRAEDAESSS